MNRLSGRTGKRWLLPAIVLMAGIGQAASAQLDLQESLRIALQRSPRAAMIRARTRQAVLQRPTLIGALLPTVVFSSGYSHTGPDATIAQVIPGTPPLLIDPAEPNQYYTTLAFDQTLFDLSAWVSLNQANLAEAAADVHATEALAELALMVKRAYYAVVENRQMVSLADTVLSEAQQSLRLARERHRIGSIGRPQLLQVETELIQQRVGMVEARGQLQKARRDLRRLLGLSTLPDIDTSLMYPDTSRPIPDEDSLVALALEFNPSLKAAIMDMEARKAGERAVRFRKVPTLGGAFAYGYSDRSQFAGFDDWARHDFWRAGVYLEWTAFDGFQWWREAKQASLQTMLTRAEVEKTGGEVEEAMRTAFDQLRAARASLGYAAALENLSEQQLRLSKEKYELDAASELEVLGSRRAYMEAQQKRIQSIIAYRLARAKVMQLMGKW